MSVPAESNVVPIRPRRAPGAGDPAGKVDLGVAQRVLIAQRSLDNGPGPEHREWDQVRRTLLSARLHQAHPELDPLAASGYLEKIVHMLDEGHLRTSTDLESAVSDLAA